VKAVDALLDFVYVGFGTVLFMQAGEHSLPETIWPSFDHVKTRAVRAGYLIGTPSVPQLLPVRWNEILKRRLILEVELFGLAHESCEPSAVPLTLAHLWNAIYAAYLGAARMNVPWANCWRHVHAKNMEKQRASIDGSDSKRGSSWDLVKPDGWIPPDELIRQELKASGAKV
jgi:predicted HAD superfamily Cof-like phosphohydrolase